MYWPNQKTSLMNQSGNQSNNQIIWDVSTGSNPNIYNLPLNPFRASCSGSLLWQVPSSQAPLLMFPPVPEGVGWSVHMCGFVSGCISVAGCVYEVMWACLCVYTSLCVQGCVSMYRWFFSLWLAVLHLAKRCMWGGGGNWYAFLHKGVCTWMGICLYMCQDIHVCFGEYA